MIVCKFGGTCSASPIALKNIAKIKRNNQRKILIFSAIGKESSLDVKMTDLLICLSKQPPFSDTYKKTRAQIIDKFEKLIKNTQTCFDIEKDFSLAEQVFLKTNDSEFLVSRGEFFTAQIMAKYLNLPFVPAEDLIYFEEQKINKEKTTLALTATMKNHSRFVMPAFYGVDENKKISLLSRGGGDFSGALVAKFLKANTYENWTDVEGIFEVNPKILKSRVIRRLSFSQLEIMTNMDSTVIHKDCAHFLKSTKTKLKIRSCFKLSTRCTVVDSKPHPNARFICFKPLDQSTEIFIQNKNQSKTLTTKNSQLTDEIRKEYQKIQTKARNI